MPGDSTELDPQPIIPPPRGNEMENVGLAVERMSRESIETNGRPAYRHVRQAALDGLKAELGGYNAGWNEAEAVERMERWVVSGANDRHVELILTESASRGRTETRRASRGTGSCWRSSVSSTEKGRWTTRTAE